MIQRRTQRRSGRYRIEGYTMVELMTVSMIISILAAMSFALLSRMRSQAIEATAMNALNALATGYEMFYYHNRSYPQWGPDEEFKSPKEIWDRLIDEDYLPQSYRKVDYDPGNGYIYGFTQDYAVEIIKFNSADPLSSSRNSYFIVFHPYNFQRDALAIGIDPPTGWVAVRARRGREGADYRTFKLFVFRRIGG